MILVGVKVIRPEAVATLVTVNEPSPREIAVWAVIRAIVALLATAVAVVLATVVGIRTLGPAYSQISPLVGFAIGMFGFTWWASNG